MTSNLSFDFAFILDDMVMNVLQQMFLHGKKKKNWYSLLSFMRKLLLAWVHFLILIFQIINIMND
jgi:hypothetical protein